MTRQKVFLWAALAAFAGWLGYLGYAVAFHRLTPPEIVSRSQLTGATYLVVAEVDVANGKPAPSVKVVHRLSGDGPTDGIISVANLPDAHTSSNTTLAGTGLYLLPLIPASEGYQVAGWPASPAVPFYDPGQELRKPDDAKPDAPTPRVRPPMVYPWTDAVQKQLRALGYSW